MGYTRRTGGNSFAGYQGASYENPLATPYKKLEVGAYVRLRIMSLAEEDTVVIPGRAVKVKNPKSGQMMTLKDIHETVDPAVMHSIIDHEGSPMSSVPQVNIFRCPVFVYYIVDEKGRREDVNELRYLEFGQGLKNSLDKLEEFQQGVGSFNQETGCPDYDVDLTIVDNNGIKNYEFQVVFIDAETKKQHMNFGKEADEAVTNVDPSFMDAVDDNWDIIQDELNKRMSDDDIRQRVEPKEQQKRGGVSSRPGLRDRGTANEEHDTSGEAETQGDQPGRFGGGRSSTGGGGAAGGGAPGRRYGNRGQN